MASYTISAPNGKSYTIEGPSGASQEDVQNEVLRQFPTAGQTSPEGAQPTPAPVTPPTPVQAPVVNPGAPARTLGDRYLRLGGITANGLVTGALSAPGELAMLGVKGIDWAGRKLINGLGGNVDPTGKMVQDIDVTGTTRQLLGALTPENEAELMVRSGAEGAGGTAMTGGAGGMKGVELLTKAGAAALGRVGLVGAAAKGAGDAVGTVSPTAGAVVEVLGNILGGPRAASKKAASPLLTSEDRFKEAQALYEKSKQSGVVITGKATNTMVDELRNLVGDRDLLANKPAHQAIDYLAKHSGDGATGWIGIALDKLMKVRSDMRNEAVGGGITQSRESKRIGYQLMNRFDELVNTMTAKELHIDPAAVRGPNGKFLPAGTDELASLKEGLTLKKAADAAYTQGSKAKLVEDMLLKAETLQGGTLAERYRAKMGQLIRNEDKFKLFSPEEQDAIRAYHKGTTSTHVTEALAKLSPARGGILPTLGAVAAVGSGGMTVPLQAIGGAAHYLSGPQAKDAQYSMLQTILKGDQLPLQPIGAYMPSEEALRAGMLSGARK